MRARPERAGAPPAPRRSAWRRPAALPARPASVARRRAGGARPTVSTMCSHWYPLKPYPREVGQALRPRPATVCSRVRPGPRIRWPVHRTSYVRVADASRVRHLLCPNEVTWETNLGREATGRNRRRMREPMAR